MSSPDWLNMDIEFVSDILGSSELVALNEFSVLEALSQWLLHESHVGNIAAYGSRLLPLIRLPQLLVYQLYQVEQGELARRPEIQPILQPLLAKAYRFRALCPSQAQLGVSFSEEFYMPRDYMELTVDNVRMQNTLRFGIQVDVKMYKGSVPMELRDGDWKVTYRKQNDVWSLQLYCHDTAMVNNEARIQACVLIYNDQEKVIQVQREAATVVTRGNSLTIHMTMDEPEQAKHMALLIKPVPC